jgi:hypothetical protein
MATPDVTQKPSTVLINGILIGAGAVLLIGSLIGAYALNDAYLKIGGFLSNSGISTTNIQYSLETSNIIELLSVCPFGFTFGSLMITLGLLDQFSERAKFAYKMKYSVISRIANGLMAGGAIATASFGGDVFRQIYESFPPYEAFTEGLFVGIIMLVIGLILLVVRKPK